MEEKQFLQCVLMRNFTLGINLRLGLAIRIRFRKLSSIEKILKIKPLRKLDLPKFQISIELEV